MEEKQRRQVACITTISKLLNGKYVKEEGWKPNYILTEDGQKVSRINIIGIVIESGKAENYQSIMFDDTTAMISVRDFENTNILQNLNPGDKITVIGRPREFNNSKYIIPEIVKKIDNDKWFEVRKLQIELEQLQTKPTIQPTIEPTKQEDSVVEEDEVIEYTTHDKVIESIRKLDTGDGADIDKVIADVKDKDTEEVISELMKKGSIFELKPGKIKVLD
jgi:RPA family protein